MVPYRAVRTGLCSWQVVEYQEPWWDGPLAVVTMQYSTFAAIAAQGWLRGPESVLSQTESLADIHRRARCFPGDWERFLG